MGRFLNLKSLCTSRKNCHVLLASVWISGIMSGCLCSVFAPDSFLDLLFAATLEDVAFPQLITAISWPFLLSVLAVYLKAQWLIFPICWAKAFVFSFLGFGIVAAYSSAGWLVRWLLMFGDCCSVPLLLWYWSRSLVPTRSIHLAILLPLMFLMIGMFDFYFVAPFLTVVIS